MGTVRTGTPRYYHVAAGSARRPSPDSFLPHRVPIVAQFARQHLLHALRLRVGKGIEPGVQIWPSRTPERRNDALVLNPDLWRPNRGSGLSPGIPTMKGGLRGAVAGFGA